MLDIPQAKKSFWMHPMVPLGDETQVEARLGPFEDSANFDARLEHGLRRTYHRLRNCLGHTRWNDVGHMESLFFPFGDSVSVGAWFALDLP